MPVTAKLSREFYERFGEKIADELVNWFNQVDATYRSDLRALNELNFARFDAKVEQRFAEADARWERRMAGSDVRWEQRMARMDQRFAELEVRWERRLADLKTSLILWMFGFWSGTTIITLGTTLAILKPSRASPGPVSPLARVPVRRWGRWACAVACVWLGGACDDPGTSANAGGIVWEVAGQSASTAPAVFDSVVVFGDAYDGAAVGFDRNTGALRWKRRWAGPGGFYPPAVKQAAGLALLPQYEVWAVDPSNGQVAWHFAGPDSGAAVHGLAASGDTVFTGSVRGWAATLDAHTGQAFWSVDLGEAPFQPAVSADLLLYGTSGFLGPDREGPLGAGHEIALRRTDGSEAWRFPLPDSDGIHGGAVSGGVVWRDRVIVGSLSGLVQSLRLSDGALLWQQAITPHGYLGSPVLVGDVVVFMRTDNVVEGRDAATGAQRWALDRSSIVTSPVAAGSYAYVIEGPVTILDASGATAWEFGGLDPLGRGTSFMDGMVADDGTIYALAVKRFTGADGTYVAAIQPPVRP